MAFGKKFSNDELRSAISFASTKLGINQLKEQQEISLLSFLRGHDVFVNLPTGYGKSVVYQAAPFCWDYLLALASNVDVRTSDVAENHTSIVVTPLVSLMKDQVQILNSRGIKANSVTMDKLKDPNEKARIYSGNFSVLFVSPEVLLDIGGELLRNSAYKGRICGVFIDESHVIKHW